MCVMNDSNNKTTEISSISIEHKSRVGNDVSDLTLPQNSHWSDIYLKSKWHSLHNIGKTF